MPPDNFKLIFDIARKLGHERYIRILQGYDHDTFGEAMSNGCAIAATCMITPRLWGKLLMPSALSKFFSVAAWPEMKTCKDVLTISSLARTIQGILEDNPELRERISPVYLEYIDERAKILGVGDIRRALIGHHQGPTRAYSAP